MKQKSIALSTAFGFAILTLFSMFWYLGQPTAVYAATLTVDQTADTNALCVYNK